MPKKFIQSVKYARLGASHALRHERNLGIHLAIGLAALVLSVVLRLGSLELAIVILTITLVIVTEMVNTAIEEVVNLAKPENHPLAALAKNIAAGAALSAALGAAAVGLLIFLTRLMR